MLLKRWCADAADAVAANGLMLLMHCCCWCTDSAVCCYKIMLQISLFIKDIFKSKIVPKRTNINVSPTICNKIFWKLIRFLILGFPEKIRNIIFKTRRGWGMSSAVYNVYKKWCFISYCVSKHKHYFFLQFLFSFLKNQEVFR